MHRLREDAQVFELFIPDLQDYDTYKYCIYTSDGRTLLKADPYAFHTETPGKDSSNASKVYDMRGFNWGDAEYIESRNQKNKYSVPMNIYEVNLLSWSKNPMGGYLTYKELAEKLVPYVKDLGYTHVEFMPLTEFPYDGSWGYQVTGYYAVTSRMGTPKDFMYLVDAFHKENIGVILDWVPAHFPKDAHGLIEFDGGTLYECPIPEQMENKGWGTRVFDYGRTEVMSFLISSALYFIDVYHIDGLRVDAVASMLYLDYDRRPGEWRPNRFGGNGNLEAVELLKRFNYAVHKFCPGALTIAEESTSWPKLTVPVQYDGLGFDYKWNMGWMNDTLRYMQLDPIYKTYSHGIITNTVDFAFSEHYVLPISHDEVVYGKGSLINKMPGTALDKYANLRAFFGYMIAYPGKKLNFMGNEFGQFDEWNYSQGIELYVSDQYPMHQKLLHMTKYLNRLYLQYPQLWQTDDSWEGFEWLAYHDSDRNVFAFARRAYRRPDIICVVNFSGVQATDYRLGVPAGKYKIIFNSDDLDFGGADVFGEGEGENKKEHYLFTENIPSHGRPQSVRIEVPRLSCIYLLKIN